MKNQKNNKLLIIVLGLSLTLFAQMATAQDQTGIKNKTPEERRSSKQV